MRAVAAFVAALVLAGCAVTQGRKIVESQTPGMASGAGATLTGPANSGAPSTQTATRTVAYAAPSVPTPAPAIPTLNVPTPSPGQPLQPPPPLWVQETVQTSIGQHQDAAAIVKVAVTVSTWGWHKWLGLCAVLVGLGGILWSYKNEESGYPLVYLKILGVGVVLLIVDNPWWLLLALVPLGLYAVQKLGLFRPIP